MLSILNARIAKLRSERRCRSLDARHVSNIVGDHVAACAWGRGATIQDKLGNRKTSERMDWNRRLALLPDSEFLRTYKLSKDAFARLLTIDGEYHGELGESLAEFPIADPAKLKRMSDGFYDLSGEVVRGCVGALDGIAFKGSCHDSTAWQITELASALKVGGMRHGYWIAADDAYGNSDYLLCPYPGRRLAIPEDSFNYFQSKCRITIERAFGILVARWQIFLVL
eukprot:gene22775-27495_t